MTWNQVDGTLAPNLQRAKEKAENMIERDEVAIISKDGPNRLSKGNYWWHIKFYDYSNGPKVVVEESL